MTAAPNHNRQKRPYSCCCICRQPTTVIPFQDMASRMNLRNVLVIRKSEAGVSTVANQLIGEQCFYVAGTRHQVTTMISHNGVPFDHGSKLYLIKVVNTPGLFDERVQNKDTIARFKQYLRDIFPGCINLVLIVFSKGRFTAEEQACLELIISISPAMYPPLRPLW